MPRAGAITLAEWPYDFVRLRCEKCGRFGQYRTSKLREEHGDPTMPDLKALIVKCERRKAMNYSDLCGARFVYSLEESERKGKVRL